MDTEKLVSAKDVKFIAEYVKSGDTTQALEYAEYPVIIRNEAGEEVDVSGKYIDEIMPYFPTLTEKTVLSRIKAAKTRLGNEIIGRPEIKHELKIQTNRMRKEEIADATEVMYYLTQVMRGNIKDQFGLDAPLSERTRAAIEIAKRTFDIEHKITNNTPPQISVHLDWSRNLTINTGEQ